MYPVLDIIEGPDYRRDDEGWQHHAYVVRLTWGDQTMDVPWRQGLGITDDPTAEAVLEALASDAATLDNAQTFEDWAEELGYDTDSRKAEAIYNQVVEQTDKLRDFLGNDFDRIVYQESALDSES